MCDKTSQMRSNPKYRPDPAHLIHMHVRAHLNRLGSSPLQPLIGHIIMWSTFLPWNPKFLLFTKFLNFAVQSQIDFLYTLSIQSKSQYHRFTVHFISFVTILYIAWLSGAHSAHGVHPVVGTIVGPSKWSTNRGPPAILYIAWLSGAHRAHGVHLAVGPIVGPSKWSTNRAQPPLPQLHLIHGVNTHPNKLWSR